MKPTHWISLVILLTAAAMLFYTLPAITGSLVLIKGAGRPIPASVQGVVDGQTLVLKLQNNDQVCLVLNGVNTPLKDQPGYRRSVLGLIDLAQGRFRGKVLVELDAVLHSQLWVGNVRSQDRDEAGHLALIRSGYAWPDSYQHESREKMTEFAAAAREAHLEARSQARGHWSGVHIGEAPNRPAQSYIQHLLDQGHPDPACQAR